MVRKLPHASTAPCFFASASVSAVTLLDKPDEVVAEIEAAGDRADDRHENVADQRRHDAAEGRADDDADRKVEALPLIGEVLEFLQHDLLPWMSESLSRWPISDFSRPPRRWTRPRVL